MEIELQDQSTDGPEVIASPVDAESTLPEQGTSPDPVSDEDAADSAEHAEGDRPPRAQQRIQQLVAEKKFAMEFAELQKRRADELEQKVQSAAPKDPPEPLSAPKLEDFEYDQDAWAAALLAYNDQVIDRKTTERVAKALNQTAEQQQQNTVDAKWKANAEKFSATHEDFNEVAFATKDIFEAIKGLDDGPAIAYHLGKNPREAERIATLPPGQMAFELGRLKVSPPPAASQKPVTRAPEPMNPVGGGQPKLSTAHETIEDFMKRRNAEEAARRRGR